MGKILMIINLIPSIVKAIFALEELIPGKGKGEMKLAILRETLTMAHEGIVEVWDKIEAIVGKVVEIANKFGEFKKD